MPGRRTVEDRVALIDEKIAKKQAEIEALEAQKNKLLHPVTMKSVMEKAKGRWSFPGRNCRETWYRSLRTKSAACATHGR